MNPNNNNILNLSEIKNVNNSFDSDSGCSSKHVEMSSSSSAKSKKRLRVEVEEDYEDQHVDHHAIKLTEWKADAAEAHIQKNQRKYKRSTRLTKARVSQQQPTEEFSDIMRESINVISAQINEQYLSSSTESYKEKLVNQLKKNAMLHEHTLLVGDDLPNDSIEESPIKIVQQKRVFTNGIFIAAKRWSTAPFQVASRTSRISGFTRSHPIAVLPSKPFMAENMVQPSTLQCDSVQVTPIQKMTLSLRNFEALKEAVKRLVLIDEESADCQMSSALVRQVSKSVLEEIFVNQKFLIPTCSRTGQPKTELAQMVLQQGNTVYGQKITTSDKEPLMFRTPTMEAEFNKLIDWENNGLPEQYRHNFDAFWRVLFMNFEGAKEFVSEKGENIYIENSCNSKLSEDIRVWGWQTRIALLCLIVAHPQNDLELAHRRLENPSLTLTSATMLTMRHILDALLATQSCAFKSICGSQFNSVASFCDHLKKQIGRAQSSRTEIQPQCVCGHILSKGPVSQIIMEYKPSRPVSQELNKFLHESVINIRFHPAAGLYGTMDRSGLDAPYAQPTNENVKVCTLGPMTLVKGLLKMFAVDRDMHHNDVALECATVNLRGDDILDQHNKTGIKILNEWFQNRASVVLACPTYGEMSMQFSEMVINTSPFGASKTVSTLGQAVRATKLVHKKTDGPDQIHTLCREMEIKINEKTHLMRRKIIKAEAIHLPTSQSIQFMQEDCFETFSSRGRQPETATRNMSDTKDNSQISRFLRCQQLMGFDAHMSPLPYIVQNYMLRSMNKFLLNTANVHEQLRTSGAAELWTPYNIDNAIREAVQGQMDELTTHVHQSITELTDATVYESREYLDLEGRFKMLENQLAVLNCREELNQPGEKADKKKEKEEEEEEDESLI